MSVGLSFASADTLLYTNALPTNTGTINNNNSVDGGGKLNDRSNGAFVQNNSIIYGDSFSLPTQPTGADTINSITVYAVGNNAGGPDSEFSSISLYGGVDGTDLSNLKTLTPGYGATSVQYVGDFYTPGSPQNYRSVASSSYFPIYAITFSGLGWTIPTGVTYDFAVGATTTGGNQFSLLAVSGPLAGVAREDGTDGVTIGFIPDTATSGNPYIATYGYGTGFPGSIAGWSDSVGLDVNVSISGIAATPEPSSWALAGCGLLAAWRLRRRRS